LDEDMKKAKEIVENMLKDLVKETEEKTDEEAKQESEKEIEDKIDGLKKKKEEIEKKKDVTDKQDDKDDEDTDSDEDSDDNLHSDKSAIDEDSDEDLEDDSDEDSDEDSDSDFGDSDDDSDGDSSDEDGEDSDGEGDSDDELEDIDGKIKDLEHELEEIKSGNDSLGSNLQNAVHSLKEDNQRLIEENVRDLVSDAKELGIDLEMSSDNTIEVTEDMHHQARQLELGLQKLINDLKAGYQRGHKSGKLNIRSFVNRKSPDDIKVFNKFVPDRLAETKILFNFFVDGSGSMMGHNWDMAIRTCWIINEALNKDNNKVMCYQFGNKNFMKFKDYDEILKMPKFIESTSTEPSFAINHAIPHIQAYQREHDFKTVVDIILTDGGFDNCEDSTFQKLNMMGHETIILNVKFFTSETHKAKHSIYVDKFEHLTPAMVQIFGRIKKGLVSKVLRQGGN
jgi:hypothetical protein